MILSTEELQENLEVLEIIIDKNEINTLSLKCIYKAFRKLAISTHPDKAGDKSTERFQKLVAAFEKVKNHLEAAHANTESNVDMDEGDIFFRDNFKKFNFPFENKGSFTVAIEDVLADEWETCLTRTLGEPKVRTNAWGTECGRSCMN